MKLPTAPISLAALERSASLSSSWADISVATGAPVRRASCRLAQRSAAQSEAILVDRLERSGSEGAPAPTEADSGSVGRLWRWLMTQGVS